MAKIYHYFVEGECEEKFINEYKKNPHCLLTAGKVQLFNFIQNVFTKSRLMALNKSTVIILVYDTDVLNTDILKLNLKLLNKYGFKNIIHIQSIKNFEDEIVYSTNIKNINDVFGSQGNNEFKSKFIKCNNIYTKLESLDFNIDKMWSRKNTIEPFNKYFNPMAHNIIINKK